jgi:hypothetical protein
MSWVALQTLCSSHFVDRPVSRRVHPRMRSSHPRDDPHRLIRERALGAVSYHAMVVMRSSNVSARPCAQFLPDASDSGSSACRPFSPLNATGPVDRRCVPARLCAYLCTLHQHFISAHLAGYTTFLHHAFFLRWRKISDGARVVRWLSSLLYRFPWETTLRFRGV